MSLWYQRECRKKIVVTFERRLQREKMKLRLGGKGDVVRFYELMIREKRRDLQ